MPPAPPGTMSGPQSSVAPPSFPLTLGPGPGGTPPQPQMHRPPGMFAQQPGMPPRPPGAMQQGLPPPPQPGMPPHSQPGVPPPPPTGMPTQPGMQPQPGMPPTSSPPSAAGAGITGRRQYPQMVRAKLTYFCLDVLTHSTAHVLLRGCFCVGLHRSSCVKCDLCLAFSSLHNQDTISRRRLRPRRVRPGRRSPASRSRPARSPSWATARRRTRRSRRGPWRTTT